VVVVGGGLCGGRTTARDFPPFKMARLIPRL